MIAYFFPYIKYPREKVYTFIQFYFIYTVFMCFRQCPYTNCFKRKKYIRRC